MSATYLAAWLLPWLAGTGLWLLVNRGWRGPADFAAAAGYGLLIGLFLAATLTALVAANDTRAAFSNVSPWLIGIGVIAWSAALGLRRRAQGAAASPLPFRLRGFDWYFAFRSDATPPLRLRLLWWCLFALLLARLLVIADEALLRPLFPWDGWSAWAVKPKSWYLLGHVEPYVGFRAWLAHPDDATRTVAVWSYPELLAWLQVWFASAAGGWREPLIDVAWCGALVALGLAAYGQWRALRLPPWLAMVLVYGLLSLPLPNAHAALAGYADLWLAATFGLAMLAWARWLREREPGQLLLAGVLAFTMPAVKLEGAVWLLAFGAVFVLGLLRPRWRWGLIGGGLAVVAIGLALGGFGVPLPGLGWVRFAWGEVQIPALGTLPLYWRPVGGAMLAGLFTLPNWHLLWYLVPVLLVWRRRVLLRDAAAGAMAAVLGLCALFLFVLFFFTEASQWAENYTSANRLILQVVPVVFVLFALLLDGVDGTQADSRSP